MAGRNLFRNNLFGLFILIVAVLLVLSGIYADWLWFDSLGYLSVFKKWPFDNALAA